MANKAKRRIRALQAARPEGHYQGLWNREHRQGAEALLALRCDICSEPLYDGRSQSMVQWLAELDPDPPMMRVAALFLNHKGPCDDVVEVVAARLDLAPLWEEMNALVDPAGHEKRAAVLDLYDWTREHQQRLRRLFQDVAIANKHGWRSPPSSGWAAKWKAPILLEVLGRRVAGAFAEDSAGFGRALAEAQEQGLPNAANYFASVFAKVQAQRRTVSP